MPTNAQFSDGPSHEPVAVWTSDGKHVTLRLPRTALDFARRFDAGEFPGLIYHPEMEDA